VLVNSNSCRMEVLKAINTSFAFPCWTRLSKQDSASRKAPSSVATSVFEDEDDDEGVW